MDNKKTGKFIAQCRKEMKLSQKQLAERLNVTDKAVSKWETGNGSPDISLLTKIAEILNISVVELLNGERLQVANAQELTERIVIEALHKAKKERIKTVISVFSVLIILFTLINVGIYGYWGRRHKVLYNVDTVFIHQNENDQNIYDLYYNCSVKNWWFDYNTYTYKLVAELGGEPSGWNYETKTDYVTSNCFTETPFVIHVVFDISSINDNKLTIEQITKMFQFSAYDTQKKRNHRINLYMSDFDDVCIIMI